MKILLFTHEFPPFAGGAGIYTANLAKGLSQIGHSIYVLAPAYYSTNTQWDSEQSYNITRVAMPRKHRVIAGAIKFCKSIYSINPDFIIITDSGAQLSSGLGMTICRKSVPHGVTVHGLELERLTAQRGGLRQTIFNAMMRKVLFQAKAILCVSNSTRQELVDLHPELVKRSHVVYNGVDPKDFPLSSTKAITLEDEKLNGSPIILTVGRLVREKGIHSVLKTLPKLKQDFPKLLYVIAGEGPEQHNLESLVEELGLSNHVRFTGKLAINKLNYWYSKCDVFVLVSASESFGIVYVEAALHNKPVIGGNRGGIKEVVKDGETGFLVKFDDILQIESKIRYLLTEKKIAKKMGQAGYQHASNEFTIEKMAKRTISVLTDVH